MLFSVIYSVDAPEGEDIDSYAPPHVDDLWQQTESDEQCEYTCLEGAWENGQHRKWGAVLDREQFDEFVEKLGLYADSTPTMGSLGAPGLGYGVSPAIAFSRDDPDAVLSCYVTPMPETRKEKGDARDWKRVVEAVLSVYGD